MSDLGIIILWAIGMTLIIFFPLQILAAVLIVLAVALVCLGLFAALMWAVDYG